MARVRGQTSILRRYASLPDFVAGNTGEGRLYPLGALFDTDNTWDLFAALCARVTAWKYTFDNRIHVAYTAGGGTLHYEYTLTETGTGTESALSPSVYASVFCPGDTVMLVQFPAPVSPAAAAASEKVFAHPNAYIQRNPMSGLFTGTLDWSIVDDGGPDSSGTETGNDASTTFAQVLPMFANPALNPYDNGPDVLITAPTFATDRRRYLSLDAVAFFGDEHVSPPVPAGDWTYERDTASGDFVALKFNQVTAGLVRFEGFRQVGALTIRWPHWQPGVGIQEVALPLYAHDPFGSRATIDPGLSAVTVEHEVNVLMEVAAALPYGRDDADPDALSTSQPVYNSTNGEPILHPLMQA